MSDQSLKILTAIREAYLQGEGKESILRTKFNIDNIEQIFRRNGGQGHFYTLINELVQGKKIYLENGSAITITIDGLTYGISLDNLPEYIEKFVIRQPIQKIRKFRLTKVTSNETQKLDGNENIVPGSFGQYLKENRTEIVNDLIQGRTYIISCSADDETISVEISDIDVSTDGECWLKIKDKDLVMRKNP